MNTEFRGRLRRSNYYEGPRSDQGNRLKWFEKSEKSCPKWGLEPLFGTRNEPFKVGEDRGHVSPGEGHISDVYLVFKLVGARQEGTLSSFQVSAKLKSKHTDFFYAMPA